MKRAFSPAQYYWPFPGASPQAGMKRALGAETLHHFWLDLEKTFENHYKVYSTGKSERDRKRNSPDLQGFQNAPCHILKIERVHISIDIKCVVSFQPRSGWKITTKSVSINRQPLSKNSGAPQKKGNTRILFCSNRYRYRRGASAQCAPALLLRLSNMNYCLTRQMSPRDLEPLVVS
jgi:hypothetical protein